MTNFNMTKFEILAQMLEVHRSACMDVQGENEALAFHLNHVAHLVKLVSKIVLAECEICENQFDIGVNGFNNFIDGLGFLCRQCDADETLNL